MKVEITLNKRPLSYVEDDIQMELHFWNGNKFEESDRMQERAIQYLFLIELYCHLVTVMENYPATLNIDAQEYIPKISTTASAKLRVTEATEYQNKLPTVKTHLNTEFSDDVRIY